MSDSIKNTKVPLWAILTFVSIVFLINAMPKLEPDNSVSSNVEPVTQKEIKDDFPRDYNVHFIAKQTIKAILRNPRDAAFPSITDIKITNLGNGTWTVLGYVDATNGYGANQRSRYKVEMHARDNCSDYNNINCWDQVTPYME